MGVSITLTKIWICIAWMRYEMKLWYIITWYIDRYLHNAWQLNKKPEGIVSLIWFYKDLCPIAP